MSIILDIILLTLLVISFIIGYKRGFIKSIWKITALVITIVLVMALKTPAENMLKGTQMAEGIHNSISEKVRIPQGGGVNIAETLNLPEFMQSAVNTRLNGEEGVVTSLNLTAAQVITGISITIIACVGLFVIIRLILMAAYIIISGTAKLPVIRGVNKFIGGIFGAVNMVFIIFLLLAIVSLYASADNKLFEMINDSYIVKYFYNYNILLKLFMRI